MKEEAMQQSLINRNQEDKNTSKYSVEVKNLKKAFNGNEVLKDITFNIQSGQNLVVLGKSGTGKSVTIKCMVGLITPDFGSIHIMGKDIETLSNKEFNEVRKKVGFLFQSAALYDSMSVRENMIFPLRTTKNISNDEKNTLAEEVLESVGLLEAIDKMPSELSGGMRKRAGLARTLILKPDIMLYDEPTTGLDPITSREISQLMLEIQKKHNTTSIIITHDMDCARVTSNRVIVLKDGVVHVEGTFDELDSSEDEFIQSFFAGI